MIQATIIADSISPQGVRLTTYELIYPRIIHAEVMTHRVFSRNAQSSRAVPVTKALGLVDEYYTPVVWGSNKAGMSAGEELSKDSCNAVAYYWHSAVKSCKDAAFKMAEAGLHKQWANRCLEWFSPIKVIVTATEWENFFWLRDDPEAAQPEIVELARKMKEARDASNPTLLKPGQWHLPYITYLVGWDQYVVGEEVVDLETAKKVSAACCAAVSYRNNPSIEKCLEIYDKLFTGPKPHLSPVEHQATPIDDEDEDSYYNLPGYSYNWQKGITHCDRDGEFWSGNLREWIQLRQLIV